MEKEDERKYIRKAIEYLKPIKSCTLEIQSAKRELQSLRSDITSLSAIDYSKDRVSGGGIKAGLEASIAKMLESEAKCLEKTNALIQLREEARKHIECLQCVEGKIALMQEYVNGMSFKGVVSFIGYSKTQVQSYKKEALIELGQELTQIVPN